jgi:hypothetical protein
MNLRHGKLDFCQICGTKIFNNPTWCERHLPLPDLLSPPEPAKDGISRERQRALQELAASFFTDAAPVLSGLISDMARRRLSALKSIATGALHRGMLCLRPRLNAVGQVLRKGVKPFGPQ